MFPQGAAGGQAPDTRGLPPAEMLEHVPTLPVRVQLWHEPPHAPSQQTPSVQLPLAQSPGAPQACPFARVLPHLLSTLRQVWPATQSVFWLQVVRQDGLVALQT